LLILLSFSSAYAIRKSQENQDRMILNGTHSLLLYADDHLLHKYIYTINQNTPALLVATNEVGLKANVEKMKLQVMSGCK
jgi:hypothetical protein